MDAQLLPINFALIHMAFLLLMHKENGKLARNETNLRMGSTNGPSGEKESYRIVMDLYKSIPGVGLRPLVCWDCKFEYRRWILVFCECCALRYSSLRRADHSAVLLKTQDVTLHHWINRLVPHV